MTSCESKPGRYIYYNINFIFFVIYRSHLGALAPPQVCSINMSGTELLMLCSLILAFLASLASAENGMLPVVGLSNDLNCSHGKKDS